MSLRPHSPLAARFAAIAAELRAHAQAQPPENADQTLFLTGLLHLLETLAGLAERWHATRAHRTPHGGTGRASAPHSARTQVNGTGTPRPVRARFHLPHAHIPPRPRRPPWPRPLARHVTP